MKRQKRSLWKRRMAALLAAVLLVSMASDAVPMTVLANEESGQQETTETPAPDGQQEISGGKTAGTGQGDVETEEEPETTPVETPDPEKPKQETPKPDGETAKQETVSENDADEGAADTDNVAQGLVTDGDNVILYDALPMTEERTTQADAGYTELTYAAEELGAYGRWNNIPVALTDGKLIITFVEQYSEYCLDLPKALDMADCESITIRSADQSGSLCFKIYDSAKTELKAYYGNSGQNEYMFTPDFSGSATCIGVRADDSGSYPFGVQMVSITFRMKKVPGDESYTVTVNNGTGGGAYAAGDTVTITADAPASGKQFDKWVVNSGNVTLGSATSSTTTFTMPAGAVSVMATYKNKSGSSSGSGNSGNSGDADGGDNNNGGGNADGGNNNNGSGDNGSGSAGHAGGTGAGTSKTPGAPGTGQPKVKQEKEGNIQKEVRVEGESTLDAAVETPLSELADMVLTKEEKQKAAGGTDVKVVLEVKDASAVVSAADKTLVEKALNGSPAKGYTLGQYLDINLFKVIGDSRSAITETNGKVTVTIDVPDSLKNTDAAKTRTFAVIRVHGGKTAVLPDLDNNKDTITIKTDRFSTYAVVYKDTAGGNGSAVRVSVKDGSRKSGGAKDDEPDTGDSTPMGLGATLSMIAGLTYLLLYFTDRRHGMTEEMKRELVSRMIGWAKQGGRGRRYLALAAIFVLLAYYHSIGKKTCAEWKAVYGE